MTSDWRVVYMQERRRPAYVIENGKSITKTHEGDSPLPKARTLRQDKRKAA